jgi:hypothetical protein
LTACSIDHLEPFQCSACAWWLVPTASHQREERQKTAFSPLCSGRLTVDQPAAADSCGAIASIAGISRHPNTARRIRERWPRITRYQPAPASTVAHIDVSDRTGGRADRVGRDSVTGGIRSSARDL